VAGMKEKGDGDCNYKINGCQWNEKHLSGL